MVVKSPMVSAFRPDSFQCLGNGYWAPPPCKLFASNEQRREHVAAFIYRREHAVHGRGEVQEEYPLQSSIRIVIFRLSPRNLANGTRPGAALKYAVWQILLPGKTNTNDFAPWVLYGIRQKLYTNSGQLMIHHMFFVNISHPCGGELLH